MFKTGKQRATFFKISVFVILVFKLILSGLIPLLDKTESRYGEIARLMYETQEWIVLQIDYGIPFWAKPPLSTWLSAMSFEVFGVNEFAVRLPSFLLAIGVLLLVGNLVKKMGHSFYVAAFILLTMPEFLIHAGVVSTDSALGFSVVLIMLSFWQAMQTPNKNTLWGYLFFVGVGLGLLSKGPIVLILTAPPIFIWSVLKKQRFKEVFTRLPWILGVLLTLLIAIPWYLYAEKKSPGFIDYFIVGEHFKRFVVSGWKGDLYGSGHSQPLGMIWLFLLAFAFPWIQLVCYKLWKTRKTIFKNDWTSFLILWLFWTPFFFTFSSNILHTYIYPVLVPIALLMIYWWKDYQKKNTVVLTATIFPALVVIGTFIYMSGALNGSMNTDKYLLEKQEVLSTNKITPIYYWKRKSYSGQFYSRGRAEIVANETDLKSLLEGNNNFYFVVTKKQEKEIPQKLKEKLLLLDSNMKRSLFQFTP